MADEAPLVPTNPAPPEASRPFGFQDVMGFVKNMYAGKNKLGAVPPPAPAVAPPVPPAPPITPAVGLPSPTGRPPVFNPAGEQIAGVRTRQAEIDRQTEM